MRALLLPLAALLVAPAAAAQGSFLPFIGYDFDTENALVGVGTRVAFPMPSPVRLAAQPTIEYQLADEDGDLTLVQADLNVVAELPSAAAAPYVGAGVALQYLDVAGVGSDTEVGLNLLAGVLLNPVGFAQPFVQTRYTILDGGERFSVMGGIALGL